MNCKLKSNLILFLILSLFSFNSFSVVSTDSELIAGMDQFYLKLKENNLLLRHDFNRYREKVKKASNEIEFNATIEDSKSYLNFILSNISNMRINATSKVLIRNSSQKLLGLIDKASYKTIKKNKILLEEVPAIVTPELSARPKLVEVADTGPIRKHIKPIQVFHEQKNIATSAAWYLFASMGVLSCIGIIFIKRKRIVTSDVKQLNRETSSLGLNSVALKNYKNSQAPVILLNENDFIDWSNDKAKSSLELTSGSSFFLENELIEDFKSNQLYYEFNKTKYSIIIKPVNSKKSKKKILFFIPTVEKAFKTYKLVEKSLPIGSALEETMNKFGYLFSESGIPVFFDNRIDEAKIDKRETKSFEKILLLSYSLCKDQPGTRINFILESNKKGTMIQLDIRGINKSQLDFSQKVSINNTTNYTYSDYFHELELELADRNARIFCFENDEIHGVTFQFSMSSNSYSESHIQ